MIAESRAHMSFTTPLLKRNNALTCIYFFIVWGLLKVTLMVADFGIIITRFLKQNDLNLKYIWHVYESYWNQAPKMLPIHS